ncbi:histidinol-phosphate transaminase [Inquilinus sp. CAU 1745]|uniref:histidinol-phosphate transaminase n=1 Tax=Inquilinus sp. CAU 1745 TaxID=3140369 RepID=UPI00325B0F8E
MEPVRQLSRQPTPRPGILEISPYVGGESTAEAADNRLGRLIRLASNEGAFGPGPKAAAAYLAQADNLHRYPDGGSTALRRALAARYGLDADRIVCGAGSDEIISLLVRSYVGPGDEVVYSAHGFLMYPLSAKAAGAIPVAAPERDLRTDVDAMLAAVTERTKLVFIANPNNPTGSYLSAGEMERLHAGLPPNVILVIDAAYAEYMNRNDYADGSALVDRFDNVVMTRTFSKIHGLGSLRLGWGYCPAGIADVLNRVRGPFNVSAAAQAAGLAALEDMAFVDRSRAHNEACRERTAEALRALGLTVHPSVANFLLVDFGGRDAEAARLHLKRHGVLVRQMGAYGLPGCLRVSIGQDAEMDVLVELLSGHLGG